MSPCVFCQIVAKEVPATVVYETPNVLAFVPLRPATAGHVLFVPRAHYTSAADCPAAAGIVVTHAARWAAKRYDDFNLVTSSGAVATQTVMHLHVHVIPRRGGDQDLPKTWPWLNLQVTDEHLDRLHGPGAAAAIDAAFADGSIFGEERP